MKKSFLYTFVVLGVFSIFLTGNYDVALAQEDSSTEANYRAFDPYNPSSQEKAERNPAFDPYNSPTNVPTSQANPTPAAASTPTSSPVPNSNSNPLGGEVKDGGSLGIVDGAQTVYLAVLIGLTQFIGWIMGLGGWIFDYVVAYTTRYPQELATGIYGAWKIIRDFSNIILVFSLLYLGIKTILEGNGFAEKRTLVGIILAAILINFSFAFTKDVAFTVSNTVGLQILQQANVGKQATDGHMSYSAGFMTMVNPQTLLNGWQASNIAANSDWSMIISFTGRLILFTFVAVCLCIIFMGVSITLVYRFLIFIVLIIFSPFGLISTQIPWLKSMGKDWVSQLKKQVVYFPAFALVLYLVLYITTTLIVNSGPPTITVFDWNSTFMFLFKFILIIGFMLGLLILPGKIGAAGADLMTNVAGWGTKKLKNIPRSSMQFGGRVAASGTARTGRTLGKWGGSIIGGSEGSKRREKLQLKAQEGGWWARQKIKASEGLKNQTYDVRSTKFGGSLGMGKGIESWNKAVDSKKKVLDERKKKEEKILGYDQIAKSDDNKAKVTIEEAKRDTHLETISKHKEELKAAQGRHATDAEIKVITDKIKESEKELGAAELAVGMAKNAGDSEYLKLMQQRQKRWTVFGKLNAAEREAIEKLEKDMKKKWKEEGKAKQTTKKKTTTPKTPAVTISGAGFPSSMGSSTSTSSGGP